MQKLKLHIAFVLAFLLSSCGSAKLVNGSKDANPGFSVKDIIKTHQAAEPQFETLAARVNVDYEDEKSSQNITVSLRMEKNKAIWIKASILGITLSKAMITPDRVQYYERIGGTYFDGDFALISDWLGTEIDFEKAQNILLGQSIFKLESQGYKKSVENNQYKLAPKQELALFTHFLSLNPDFFKIASQGIDQETEGRKLRMYYPNYQKVDNQVLPKKVVIKASENDAITTLEIDFRSVDLNIPIRFPFTMPDGLTEIQLD
ncbi:DUF4292 domain-containing protein [Gilvibacter sp.]|uniref:DUF4292 domain-containing protein n=1 Tax=Gilvibacter sp. TaxID=2729997 RepID=UPI003F49B90F